MTEDSEIRESSLPAYPFESDETWASTEQAFVEHRERVRALREAARKLPVEMGGTRSPAERVPDPDVPSFERSAQKRILGRLARAMSLSSQVRLGLVPWSLLAALTGPHPAMR